MSTRVLKFQLPIGHSTFDVDGVITGKVSVGMQRGETCCWFPVRASEGPIFTKRRMEFLVTLTGEEFNSKGYEYLGHCITEDGSFVTHVFARI